MSVLYYLGVMQWVIIKVSHYNLAVSDFLELRVFLNMFSVSTDFLVYAGNNGNLSHRIAKCYREYICWTGNIIKLYF